MPCLVHKQSAAPGAEPVGFGDALAARYAAHRFFRLARRIVMSRLRTWLTVRAIAFEAGVADPIERHSIRKRCRAGPRCVRCRAEASAGVDLLGLGRKRLGTASLKAAGAWPNGAGGKNRGPAAADRQADPYQKEANADGEQQYPVRIVRDPPGNPGLGDDALLRNR